MAGKRLPQEIRDACRELARQKVSDFLYGLDIRAQSASHRKPEVCCRYSVRIPVRYYFSRYDARADIS